MSSVAVALVLFGATPDLPAAVEAPRSEGLQLQLQLQTLQTRRSHIHWIVPAIVAGVGLYAAWTGVEGEVVSAVWACRQCGTGEAVSIGFIIGGAVVALAGILWLAFDFHLRSALNRQIEQVEQRLLDLRGPAPALAAFRF
jgi:hypothetical protein